MSTLDSLKSRCIASVSQLLALRDFETFQENKLGNDLFISDPDRANRIHEAAEHGCDGSTHAEHIDDWREFAADLYEGIEREAWNVELGDTEAGELDEYIAESRAALEADINRCEAWHEANGSLHEQGA